MLTFLEPLFNGILLGGLYAVIGIGLSMIFGIMRQVNLAHGEIMILSSYLGLVFMNLFGIHPLVTIVFVFPSIFVIGYLIQAYLFNRVLGKGVEPYLMISFGLSIILQNLLLKIFTPDARSLKTILAIQTLDVFGLFHVPAIYVIDFGAGLLMIGLLHLFMKKTYLGWAIRAAGDDLATCKLMGINIRKTFSLAMGIAAITAGMAGLLVGMTFTFYPHSGTQYLIIAFGVVIIGGMGSLPGTLVGGLILGVSQLLGGRLLGPGFQLLGGYLILLIVLTIRPQGLFGRG